jgi:hypothetical protein
MNPCQLGDHDDDYSFISVGGTAVSAEQPVQV